MARLCVIAGLLLALVSVSPGSAAREAFPGRNGRIAFTSVRANGGAELYTLDLKTSRLTRLTAHAPVVRQPPSWSPDGRTLVVLNEVTGNPGAALVDIRSKRVRPLPIVDVSDIAWSPDGRYFAYSGLSAGNAGLWIARRDGSAQRQLTQFSDTQAAWSPRGERIAFTHGLASGRPEIETIGLNGRRLRMLGDGDSPSWSPDGKRLVVRVTAPYARTRLVVTSANGRSRRTVVVVPGTCVTSGPAWSPTGEIAYAASCGSTSQLRSIRPDGSNPRRLIRRLPGFTTTPSWSPNGRTLAFAENTGRIWLANRDGTRLRRLFSRAPGGDFRPAWSPDGHRIAAVLSGDPTSRAGIRLVDSPVSYPAWSPDGRRLVGMKGEGETQVVVVDLASRTERLIHEDTGPGTPTLLDPAWSPDGRSIAFHQVDFGNIVFLDLRSHRYSAPRRSMEGSDPAWSPDGQRLAFTAFEEDHRPTADSAVYIADADGTHQRLLTTNASQPAWSPDGQQIVFVRTLARGNTELFVTDADGTHQRRLTFNAGQDLAPDWQALPR